MVQMYPKRTHYYLVEINYRDIKADSRDLFLAMCKQYPPANLTIEELEKYTTEPNPQPYIDWEFLTWKARDEFLRVLPAVQAIGVHLEHQVVFQDTRSRAETLTREQFDYWQQLISSNVDRETIGFYYRYLHVADEEETRIIEDADAEGQTTFVNKLVRGGLPDTVAELLYQATRNGNEFDTQVFAEYLHPFIPGLELELWAHACWESICGCADYEEYLEQIEWMKQSRTL